MKRKFWNVAMRGRENRGGWKQTLEVNYTDICNAITTVQKDNFILEKVSKTEVDRLKHEIKIFESRAEQSRAEQSRLIAA